MSNKLVLFHKAGCPQCGADWQVTLAVHEDTLFWGGYRVEIEGRCPECGLVYCSLENVPKLLEPFLPPPYPEGFIATEDIYHPETGNLIIGAGEVVQKYEAMMLRAIDHTYWEGKVAMFLELTLDN